MFGREETSAAVVGLMNERREIVMRKFILVVLAASGLLFAAAPESQAGVSIGIGVGLPGFYYAPYSYGYYPGGYYPYGYCPAYRPFVGVSYYRPYYWSHGRRYYRPYRHYRH